MSSYRSEYLLVPPTTTRFEGPADVKGAAWVYYHLAVDSSVLYIGKTIRPEARTRSHEVSSRWFSEVARTIWFGPIDEVNAAAVERELISVEQPPNNIRHTDREDRLQPAPVRLFKAQERVQRATWELAAAERALDVARRRAGATAAESSA